MARGNRSTFIHSDILKFLSPVLTELKLCVFLPEVEDKAASLQNITGHCLIDAVNGKHATKFEGTLYCIYINGVFFLSTLRWILDSVKKYLSSISHPYNRYGIWSTCIKICQWFSAFFYWRHPELIAYREASLPHCTPLEFSQKTFDSSVLIQISHTSQIKILREPIEFKKHTLTAMK